VSAEKSPVDGWIVDDRFLGLLIHSILVHSIHFIIINYRNSFKKTQLIIVGVRSTDILYTVGNAVDDAHESL
jgi:hypothetical protein